MTQREKKILDQYVIEQMRVMKLHHQMTSIAPSPAAEKAVIGGLVVTLLIGLSPLVYLCWRFA